MVQIYVLHIHRKQPKIADLGVKGVKGVGLFLFPLYKEEVCQQVKERWRPVGRGSLGLTVKNHFVPL